MPNALIGHTGFVGSHLLAQMRFTHRYNSKNIEDIRGRDFDQVVCCAAPAEKWRANADPAADWANLRSLMECVECMTTRHLILISTIDVFHTPRGVDEDSAIQVADHAHYGKHRYLLERFLSERFDTTVVRLPGLFGPGLKKNVIYDFMNNNQVERIHSDAVFQFYDLTRLWRDLQVALQAGIKLVHFATQPLQVAIIADQVFGRRFTNYPTPTHAYYDMRTKYDQLFGGTDGYLSSRDEVLRDLRRFVESQRMERRCA